MKDFNGNSTLLVPNIPSTRIIKGRSFNRVEYDQLASHLHHAYPIIESFSDGQFRMFASFLFSQVIKHSNRWLVQVYFIEDLHLYNYPIFLSKFFVNYKNLTDCFLKAQLITCIGFKTTNKIFYFSNFIQQLKLSNYSY